MSTKEDYTDELFQETIDAVERTIIERAKDGQLAPGLAVFAILHCKNCHGFHKVELDLQNGGSFKIDGEELLPVDDDFDLMGNPKVLSMVLKKFVDFNVSKGGIPIAVFVVTGSISLNKTNYVGDYNLENEDEARTLKDEVMEMIKRGETTPRGTGDGFTMLSKRYDGKFSISVARFERSLTPPAVMEYGQTSVVDFDSLEGVEIRTRIGDKLHPATTMIADLFLEASRDAEGDMPKDETLADRLFGNIIGPLANTNRDKGKNRDNDEPKIFFSDN